MELPLREPVKLELSSLHRSLKEKYLADRVKSIQLIDKGYLQKEIAEILEVSEKTVYNWKQEFLKARDIGDFALPRVNHHLGKLDAEKKTSLLLVGQLDHR